METPDHESKPAVKHPSPVRALKLAGFILALLAIGLLIGVLLTSFTKPDTKQVLIEQSENKTLPYTLHYVAKLPPGYAIQKDTIAVNETVATFTMVNNETSNRLYIAQQKRPLLMEEVNKTREFNTTLGKAYIADLNGRTAGFILAGDTLIIINSSDEIDLNILRQLMESMTKV